jgi:hypothetical protein
MKKNPLLFLTLSLLLPASASAEVLVTYTEKPDGLKTTLGGANVFSLDDLEMGYQSDVAWKGVGTFNQLFTKSDVAYAGPSDDLSSLTSGDAYASATDNLSFKGSLYSFQGHGSKVLSSTLTLDQASSYFGLWWSGGDDQSLVQFYNKDALVAQFLPASLLNTLPSENTGDLIDGAFKDGGNLKLSSLAVAEDNLIDGAVSKDEKSRIYSLAAAEKSLTDPAISTGKPYGFINFFGDAKTSWDSIVLTSMGKSELITDNYTSRVEAWDPLVDGALPGVPVAIGSGKESKQITKDELQGTLWAAAPAAPLPPLPLLVAFGTLALARSRFGLARAPQQA